MKRIFNTLRGLAALCLAGLLCLWITPDAERALFPRERGQLTCQELLDGPIAPRLRCELTDFQMNDNTSNLSLAGGQEDVQGRKAADWYMPVVPETSPMPGDLSEVTLLLRLREEDYEQLEDGSIRVQTRLPQADSMLLDGSGDSALLAHLPDDLSPDTLWILEPASVYAGTADWSNIWILFPAACAVIGIGLLMIYRTWFAESLQLWQLLSSAAACLGCGTVLLLVEPRLSPSLVMLRPGIAMMFVATGTALTAMCLVCWIRNTYAGINDRKARAMVDGDDDARIVVLPDSVRVKQTFGPPLEIPDSAMTGSLLQHQRVTDNRGDLAWFKSIMTLEYDLGDGVQQAKVKHRMSSDLDDPLVALSDRLEIEISQRWLRDLDNGDEIRIHGWILDRYSLRSEHFWSSREIRIDEIRDVISDGLTMRVHREQDVDPCLSLSRKKLNVEVLKRTLECLLEQRNAREQPAQHALGPVVSQRDVSIHAAVGPAIVVSLIGGFILHDAGFALDTPVFAVFGGFACLAVMYATVWTAGAGMQIRERGLIMRRWWRDRQYFWDQIDGMTWKQQNLEKDGQFMGRVAEVTLMVNDNGDHRRVKFAERFVKDEKLEQLQDRITQSVADRMQRRLSEDGRCDWTSKVAYTPLGLHVRPWLGLGPARTILYGEVQMETISEKKVRLRDGNGQTITTLLTAAPNYFPGMELLKRLSEDTPVAWRDAPAAELAEITT